MPPDQTDCLVYDKRRKFVSQQPIPDPALNEMKKREGTGEFKAFFEAQWDKFAEGWIIGKMVADQCW